MIGDITKLITFYLFSGRHGLTDVKRVEMLESKILAALRDHVTYNPEAKKKPQYMTRKIYGYYKIFLALLRENRLTYLHKYTELVLQINS